MPVILKHHNPCPPLGIANGSQGIVIDFAVEKDHTGLTVLQWTLIHFPQSTVNLPGLPKGHIVLAPIDSSFSTELPAELMEDNEKRRVKVTRHQAEYELGFCVTGHSAQGKTLLVVITDLRIGGSAAYVAASRPKTRNGLIILDKVSKDDLNKPLPPDLLMESHRLEALEHNTLVRNGFLQAPLVDVPDPERDLGMNEVPTNLVFTVSGKKRKNTDTKSYGEPKAKRPRQFENQSDSLI
jgi:hypothetical protein